MSNKTQLQTNNTKYASLIETLRGKAAGGSGGGINNDTIDICTVMLDSRGIPAGTNVWFTVIDDTGNITTKNVVTAGYITSSSAECLNVVCGSLLIAEYNWSTSEILGTAERIFVSDSYSIFKAPVIAGENCSIFMSM
jgi:hypothetical protein